MAIEHCKAVVLAIEHRKTFSSITQSDTAAFARRSSVPQTRTVVDYTHFEHHPTGSALDPDGASLLACRDCILQRVLDQRLQQETGHQGIQRRAIDGVLQSQPLAKAQSFRSQV